VLFIAVEKQPRSCAARHNGGLSRVAERAGRAQCIEYRRRVFDTFTIFGFPGGVCDPCDAATSVSGLGHLRTRGHPRPATSGGVAGVASVHRPMNIARVRSSLPGSDRRSAFPCQPSLTSRRPRHCAHPAARRSQRRCDLVARRQSSPIRCHASPSRPLCGEVGVQAACHEDRRDSSEMCG